ncbi:uncharacterized protein GIQ15_06920 [Arthroderma uncinatum]|uniref:uncharacterized protein n=1 Tax=Arthroderma uncinatum TaxID=74035 RepID=UPI00144A97FD|nr:uncharacterized protein GIQ15_06920 [Arthroderma uncinatum]KAF3479944.1 hypothetical protein GIQ15_06920 [Arthroderma uncinatum]
MSRHYSQEQAIYQSPVRDEETWRELSPSDNTYTASPRSQMGYLSPLAPPMTFSNSTDSDRSNSTVYSSTSTRLNTMTSCHSPRSPYEYDINEHDSRQSTQEQADGFPTSLNQDYLFDSQYMARVSPSPRSSNTERSSQRFICLYENCEGSFSRVADLSRHQKSIHFPTKMDCPKSRCNRKGYYGFTREDHLTEHLRQYHGDNLAKRTSSKSKRSEARC